MRKRHCTIVASLGVLLAASCSSAHELDEAEASTDSSSVDGPRCDRTCQPTCFDGRLDCLCAGRADERCDDYVVHCPTGVRPAMCTPSGWGVDCMSTAPGGGAEHAICVRDTAPGRGDTTCVPGCSWSGETVCFDWRRSVRCDDYVVQCPTAGHAPECNEYSVTCRLPDGDLERPICVRR